MLKIKRVIHGAISISDGVFELESSSARVTSVKLQQTLFQTKRPIVRTQGIRSYWTELLSWAELLNWAENVVFDILEPLLFENIVHVLYYLNFVFVFVSVFVFVVVFVVSGWTPVLSSFRRCMKCWLECWNRGNTEVLLIIGLMAGEEGEEKQE